MNTIKKLREERGFTQKTLAEETGLSLRTIQRLETRKNPPKGYSLTMLSKAFNVQPFVLQKEMQVPTLDMESDKRSIKLINLSILGFFIVPLGNIIFPFFVWRKRRASKLVDDVGKKIITFQILWTIILYTLLCISPFMTTSFPLILWVLFLALAINLAIIFVTAYRTQQSQFDFLNLPIRLF